MDKTRPKNIFGFLKVELRTVLALLVLLLILVGIGFAADDPTITFDFGTGLSSEVATGAISVKGGTTIYPVTYDQFSYGWGTPLIAEQSSGAVVSDLLKTDSNQGVGNNKFSISGLTGEYYQITLLSGNLTSSITTKVIADGKTYIAQSDPGTWRTTTLKAQVKNGRIDLQFQKYTSDLWAINSLTITPTVAPVDNPKFNIILRPDEHIIQSGETVVYQVSVLPENNYSNEVNLSLSNVPIGVQASFQLASGIPPYIAYLSLTVTTDLPTTHYNLDLVAKGTDTSNQTIHQTVGLVVIPKSDDIGQKEPISKIPIIIGPEPGTQEYEDYSEQQKDFIDQYLEAESTSLPRQVDLIALEELPAFTNASGSLPDFPEPRSVIDSSLRYLTTAGIIGTVVDSAPIAQVLQSSEPSGFWGNFFRAVFNPAS